MEKKVCENCGFDNVLEANFCAECGTKLGADTAPNANIPVSADNNTSPVATVGASSGNECLICGKKVGMLSTKHKCKDGIICLDCYRNTRMPSDQETLKQVALASLDEFWGLVEVNNDRLRALDELADEIQTFDFTTAMGEWAKFDDESRRVLFKSHHNPYSQQFKAEDYAIFDYDQIVDFELLEDGDSVLKGGVGRAVVGKVLFGNVGAIVGSTTRKERAVCNSLIIKMTVKDYVAPAFYVNLITSEMRKDNQTYKELYQYAQDITAKLNIIASEKKEMEQIPPKVVVEQTPQVDPVEEIRRFKELMDEGILTQEEFEAKKKQILGI